MNLLKLYFIIYKEIVAEGALKNIMHEAMREQYLIDASKYILKANTIIEKSSDVKEIANSIVNSENVKYEELEIISKIIPLQGQEDWIIDGTPRHNYAIVINAKSIIYSCIKVVDINTFICIDPVTDEIIQIVTNKDIKAIINR